MLIEKLLTYQYLVGSKEKIRKSQIIEYIASLDAKNTIVGLSALYIPERLNHLHGKNEPPFQ